MGKPRFSLKMSDLNGTRSPDDLLIISFDLFKNALHHSSYLHSVAISRKQNWSVTLLIRSYTFEAIPKIERNKKI